MHAYPQYRVAWTDSSISPQSAQDLLSSPSVHSLRGFSSNEKDDKSYHIMKLNSSTFLCTLPYLRPASSEEDNTTSLSHAEEEKERLRARKKGWDLLRPLEGNCMYFVNPQLNPLPPHELIVCRTQDGGHTPSVTTATLNNSMPSPQETKSPPTHPSKTPPQNTLSWAKPPPTNAIRTPNFMANLRVNSTRGSPLSTPSANNATWCKKWVAGHGVNSSRRIDVSRYSFNVILRAGIKWRGSRRRVRVVI